MVLTQCEVVEGTGTVGVPLYSCFPFLISHTLLECQILFRLLLLDNRNYSPNIKVLNTNVKSINLKRNELTAHVLSQKSDIKDHLDKYSGQD